MKTLPCFPCPHGSICCSWGTTVTEAEAKQMRQIHGPECVIQAPGELRTAVVNGRCVFLGNNACTIHAEPYYPQVCRCFPWADAETGGPYPGDLTICPELDDESAIS